MNYSEVYVRLRKSINSFGAMLAFLLMVASVRGETASIQIKSVQGRVLYSIDHQTWLSAEPELVLAPGSVLKTVDNSSADLILKDSSTVLRMTPGTVLEMKRLDKTVAGEQVITETGLVLKSGSIVGSQRKLARPSHFDIALPDGVATIRGTEYVIRADGAVSVVSGAV